MTDIASRGYARTDALVSTDWVAEHMKDPGVRIIESNEDPLLYPSKHIPGAVQVDWAVDLNDPVRRDYLDRASFSKLMARIGVTPMTTVVFYGDKSNWWACYAFWVFQLFGHTAAKVMDGGRLKWEQEGRPMTREVPKLTPSVYAAPPRDDRSIRSFRDEVLAHMKAGKPLVDVRSPQEFSGERTHMAEYPQEGVLRGGHIPGAKSASVRSRCCRSCAMLRAAMYVCSGDPHGRTARTATCRHRCSSRPTYACRCSCGRPPRSGRRSDIQ